MSSSFDIEFYELYWSIFIPNPLIATDPDLDVISCGGRQSYIDPWWRVEGATVAIGTTPLSIPQGVTAWPESKTTPILSYACLTEKVFAHKRGNTVSSIAHSDTGACINSRHFI